jgi:transposase
VPVELSRRLVSDEMWARVAPLLPGSRARPQGGGRARADDRAVFTAVVFVLTCDCAWRQLPQSFGVSAPTAHRRFVEWTGAGVWDALERTVGDDVDPAELDWLRVVLATARRRASS